MSDTSSSDYPRPDFVHSGSRWVSLNGLWNFAFDDDDVGLAAKWHKDGIGANTESSKKLEIKVPFVFQTPASGINNQEAHEVIWYERQVETASQPQSGSQDRLLLRFGAVDYEATLWVDGQYIGFHRGGHTPFAFDISEEVQGKPSFRITVRVRDSPDDLTQPRGKQYWKPQLEHIFYTPSSGIWQSVWLETVPAERIADGSGGTVLRANDIGTGDLTAEIALLGRRARKEYFVEVEARFHGVDVGKSGKVKVSPSSRIATAKVNLGFAKGVNASEDHHTSEAGLQLALWSPQDPNLYNVTLRLSDAAGTVLDEVQTTVGLRSLSWDDGDATFKLNGTPLFQALVLDQGYWPETGLTPPSPDSLKKDIELAKAMGFNGCRKHQKVEDPIFLYWADRLGYLVWGEMANSFEFDKDYIERFNQEWVEAMKRDINHPCVVTWTPVNETWGYPQLPDNVQQQDHIRSLYWLTRTIDPSRPVNDNDGWEHVCTDLTTFHDYSDGPQLTEVCKTIEGITAVKGPDKAIFVAGSTHKPGAPVICTEFGGVNIAPKQGEVSGERDWGYTTADNPEDLVKRIRTMMLGIVEGGLCCGFVYTQLTDVEQEVNGLYSFDRRAKLPAEKVNNIMQEVFAIYQQKVKAQPDLRH